MYVCMYVCVLLNRIKRYQIQQTSMRSNASAEDDLYDFWAPIAFDRHDRRISQKNKNEN